MTRSFGRALLGATVVAAGTAAAALTGAVSASADPAPEPVVAPSAGGPLYVESFGEFYFGTPTCPERVAANRARGDIILVDCAPGVAPGTEILVGINAGFGSS